MVFWHIQFIYLTSDITTNKECDRLLSIELSLLENYIDYPVPTLEQWRPLDMCSFIAHELSKICVQQSYKLII